MKRKKQLRCSYCGRPAILKPASEVFHDPKRTGYVYVCSHFPACNAYVGVHPGTKIPMGTLANPQLRRKRIEAHQAFDSIWKNGVMSRNQAYRWLSCTLCLTESQTHIAQFGDYMCDRVIEESRKVLLQNHLRRQAA